MATAGTTGLGAVDQVQAIVEVAREHGVRVHVDSAYGGFFTLLAKHVPPLVEPEPWLAIADADSVVVDPHKHGLQPYGCGAVLFRDPSVGRFYVHDSPYTYFTSDELHLGEISLECSRAGAAAAAFWATVQVFPLNPTGDSARCWRPAARPPSRGTRGRAVGRARGLPARRARHRDVLRRHCRTHVGGRRELGAGAAAGMTEDDPVFLSTLDVTATDLARGTRTSRSTRSACGCCAAC